MSGLTDDERGRLLESTHFSHETCEHIAPAVEQIIREREARALREAADDMPDSRDLTQNGLIHDAPQDWLNERADQIEASR